MKTPEEARKTWCPWARVAMESETSAGVVSISCAANRLPGTGGAPDPDLDWPSPRCIADECSQWVWEPAGSDMVRQSQEPGAEPRGFCGRNYGMALKVFGLAGKP